MMSWRRLASIGAVAALATFGAACGGDDDGGGGPDALGEAMCADLADGMSVNQIFTGQDLYDDPDEFAANAENWATDHCPDELEPGEPLASFIEARIGTPEGS